MCVCVCPLTTNELKIDEVKPHHTHARTSSASSFDIIYALFFV